MILKYNFKFLQQTLLIMHSLLTGTFMLEWCICCKIWLDVRKTNSHLQLVKHQKRQFREVVRSSSPVRLKVGLDKTLDSFGPALKGLQRWPPEEMTSRGPFQPVSAWSGGSHQNLPKIPTEPHVQDQMSAWRHPCCGVSSTNIATATFWWKQSQSFPEVNTWSSWHKRSERIKPPGVQSVSPWPVYSFPTTSRLYRVWVIQLSPPYRHKYSAGDPATSKDLQALPTSSPSKLWSKPISISKGQFHSHNNTKLSWFQLSGPMFTFFAKSTLRSFWEGGGQVWQKMLCLHLPGHMANIYKDHHLVAYRHDTICFVSATLITNKVVVTKHYNDSHIHPLSKLGTYINKDRQVSKMLICPSLNRHWPLSSSFLPHPFLHLP